MHVMNIPFQASSNTLFKITHTTTKMIIAIMIIFNILIPRFLLNKSGVKKFEESEFYFRLFLISS